jgi:hypothetical protein
MPERTRSRRSVPALAAGAGVGKGVSLIGGRLVDERGRL